MVDVLPILRYIPAWFPGAGFQKLGREWKKAFDDMVDVPYSFTRKMMVRHSCLLIDVVMFGTYLIVG